MAEMIIVGDTVKEVRDKRIDFETEKEKEYANLGLKYVRERVTFKWEGGKYIMTILFRVMMAEAAEIV